MNWTQIIGQKKLIEILQDSINKDRVAHAQLFVGEEGYGGLPLVLAYAQELFRRENEHSVTKVETLNHIDLHFSFPVFTKNNNSLSKNFFHEWREMILANPYASIHEWGEILDANKQLLISVPLGYCARPMDNFPQNDWLFLRLKSISHPSDE